MNTVILYGISNCDTVRKAKKWLQQHAIDYAFVDIRKQPLSNEQIEHWLQQVDWEQLLNRRSTSWRQLSADERDSVDQDSVGALLLKHPTLIKRPVLSHQQQLLIGFNESIYQKQFS